MDLCNTTRENALLPDMRVYGIAEEITASGKSYIGSTAFKIVLSSSLGDGIVSALESLLGQAILQRCVLAASLDACRAGRPLSHVTHC